MTASGPTQKQTDYLITLATKFYDKPIYSLKDVDDLVGSWRHPTVANVSATIDILKEKLERRQSGAETSEPTEAPEGGMDGNTAVTLLGKRVHLVSAAGKEETAEVLAIELNQAGEPVLSLTGYTQYRIFKLTRIIQWQVIGS